jgi:hypothetical protein
MKGLSQSVAKAISCFWRTRQRQAIRQRSTGRSDQGARSAVTGGRQMDGFIELFTDLIVSAGVPRKSIFYEAKLELPGYFRAEKKWDLLVVHNGELIISLEAKSQVGSFGNNFNNRTEEAMGSALDLWTAYREGAFNKTIRPWLGYFFVLEDSPKSRSPVRVAEPHFDVFPEFVNASYGKRYEVFCRKLVRERHYSAAAFIMSLRTKGTKGEYSEPAEDLTFESLARSLVAQAASCRTD